MDPQAREQDRRHELARALVDDDALVDHHIEEVLTALRDLARMPESEPFTRGRSGD
jgi:hypothetical protein